MSGIVWDQVDKRIFETGVDRGVLYLPDGSLVPWNGLRSVVEKFDRSTSPTYYEGMKINELVILGDFEATLKAFTYPDEFVDVEGAAKPRPGTFFGDQPPKMFGLCYRTRIGNESDGIDAGYKLHILFNVVAIPSDKDYSTTSLDPNFTEFEWTIVAVPEEFPGFHPTAHIFFDSRELDPWFLEDLESRLYGKIIGSSSLVTMESIVDFVKKWYRVKIIDHGDGTWSAVTQREGLIHILDDVDEGLFEILQVNVTYIDDVTYQLSDTTDIADIPLIKITDNGDGTWTAYTNDDSLFVVDGDFFQISNANVEYRSPVLYRVKDTPDV